MPRRRGRGGRRNSFNRGKSNTYRKQLPDIEKDVESDEDKHASSNKTVNSKKKENIERMDLDEEGGKDSIEPIDSSKQGNDNLECLSSNSSNHNSEVKDGLVEFNCVSNSSLESCIRNNISNTQVSSSENITIVNDCNESSQDDATDTEDYNMGKVLMPQEIQEIVLGDIKCVTIQQDDTWDDPCMTGNIMYEEVIEEEVEEFESKIISSVSSNSESEYVSPKEENSNFTTVNEEEIEKKLVVESMEIIDEPSSMQLDKCDSEICTSENECDTKMNDEDQNELNHDGLKKLESDNIEAISLLKIASSEHEVEDFKETAVSVCEVNEFNNNAEVSNNIESSVHSNDKSSTELSNKAVKSKRQLMARGKIITRSKAAEKVTVKSMPTKKGAIKGKKTALSKTATTIKKKQSIPKRTVQKKVSCINVKDEYSSKNSPVVGESQTEGKTQSDPVKKAKSELFKQTQISPDMTSPCKLLVPCVTEKKCISDSSVNLFERKLDIDIKTEDMTYNPIVVVTPVRKDVLSTLVTNNDKSIPMSPKELLFKKNNVEIDVINENTKLLNMSKADNTLSPGTSQDQGALNNIDKSKRDLLCVNVINDKVKPMSPKEIIKKSYSAEMSGDSSSENVSHFKTCNNESESKSKVNSSGMSVFNKLNLDTGETEISEGGTVSPKNVFQKGLAPTSEESCEEPKVQRERSVSLCESLPDADKPVKVKSRWRQTSELEMGTSSDTKPKEVCSIEIEEGNQVTKSNTPYIFDIDKDDPVVDFRLKSFTHIEVNEYLTERHVSKETKRMVCDCTLSREELSKGEKGCGEGCLNRLLLIECGAKCSLGEHCSNKRFHSREYSKCGVVDTKTKGIGIVSAENLPRDHFIMEYVGQVLDPKEFRKRAKEYAKEKNAHFYFMALKSDTVIDATLKGNISRFINHSCDPNAETQKWTVNGELRIGFFSKRPIAVGEEITFDYQLQRYGKEAQKCLCGSANCRGWLGEDPEKDTDKKELYGKKEKKEKKKKEDKPKESNDVFNDLDLQEEIEKLSSSGLKNQKHTLTLSRLMVRAEDFALRSNLLDVIKQGDTRCLRLFLDYNGLSLILSWMMDPKSTSKLKYQILEALSVLPIQNKTTLKDSKVFSIVEKWSRSQPALIENKERSSTEEDMSSSPSDHIEVKGEQAGMDDESQASSKESSSEEGGNRSCKKTVMKEENTEETAVLRELACKLVARWSELKEEFRIPKKQRVEQMKEHEREADMGYSDPRENQSYLGRWRWRERKESRFDRVNRFDKERRNHGEEWWRQEESGIRMSKEERRQRFEMQVEREERERKEAEEMWWGHQERCRQLGVDPLQTASYHPNIMGLVYYHTQTNTWQPHPEGLPENGFNGRDNNITNQDGLVIDTQQPPPPYTVDVHHQLPPYPLEQTFAVDQVSFPVEASPHHKLTPSYQGDLPLFQGSGRPPSHRPRPLLAMPPQQQGLQRPQIRQPHPPQTAPHLSQLPPPALLPHQAQVLHHQGPPYPHQGPPLHHQVPPLLHQGPPPQIPLPNQGQIPIPHRPPLLPLPHQNPPLPHQGHLLNPGHLLPHQRPPLPNQVIPLTHQTPPPMPHQAPPPLPHQAPPLPHQAPPLPHQVDTMPHQVPVLLPQQGPPLPLQEPSLQQQIVCQPPLHLAQPIPQSSSIHPPLPSPVPHRSTPEVGPTTNYQQENPGFQGQYPPGFPSGHYPHGVFPSYPNQSTSYQSPSENPAPPPPPLPSYPPPMKLPPKWKAAKDKEGRTYYYHIKTRKSQWTFPQVPPSTLSDSSTDEESESSDEEDEDEFDDDSSTDIEQENSRIEEGEEEVNGFIDPSLKKRKVNDIDDSSPLLKRARETLVKINIIPRDEAEHIKGISKSKIRDNKEKVKREKMRQRHKSSGSSSGTAKCEADTSSGPKRRIKDMFRLKMADVVVSALNVYRKPSCKVGRITSTDDFKNLARKLTHFIMLKELRHCINVEDLQCNENVKQKARDFIKKYMSKFGPVYVSQKED